MYLTHFYKTICCLALFLFIRFGMEAQVLPLSRTDSGKVLNYIDKYSKLLADNNYKEASRMMNEVGYIYWNYNQTQQAINYYEKSLELNKKIENTNGVAMIHNNLGMLYSDKENYDKALYHFSQTLATRRAQKEPVSLIASLINCAIVYNNLKKYTSSTAYLQEALSLAREMNDTKQMASAYAMLSETYEKMGNVDESLKYFALYKSFHDQLQKTEITKISGQLEEESLKKQLALAEAKTKDFELLKSQVAMEKQGAQLSTIKSVNKSLYQNLSRKEIEVALQNEALKTEKATASMVEAKNKALEKERIYSWCIAALIIIFIVIVSVIKYYDYKHIKQKNELLKEQKTQLKISNDVKDKIFSIISHDLRGPIGTMQSFFEMLDAFEVQPDLRDMLDTMALENKAVFNILDNLLNWAKTQMSELTPVFKKVNITAIVNENMQLLNTIAETKKIQIINEVSEELLAETDEDMTRIVIRNLMQNAIKFTKIGGIVKIEGKVKGNRTEISVSDTGVGMSAEKVVGLFSLKSNQSTYGTANEKGTGLGLVLCYDFIKICKGEIEVASEIGKGTTITIKLNKA